MINDKIEAILNEYAGIDDKELGEDRFHGHHNKETARDHLLTLIEEVYLEIKPEGKSDTEGKTSHELAEMKGYNDCVLDCWANFKKVMGK